MFKFKPSYAEPDTKEKLAWLRLSRTQNVGPVTFYRLIEAYGSAQAALDALPEIAKRGGRKKPLNAPSPASAEKEYRALKKLGGDMITAADDAYPLALSALDGAPPVLSILGDVSLLNKSCVGIVGARNASLNGRKFAEKLARDLGEAGQIIVSGLARGIDTAAHKGALKSGTIAVVAGGIDVVYPEENQGLYETIIKDGGLVLAESALGQKPFAKSFPRRNRIVSGISAGVIVVEATIRSGSLITARLAGKQGRDVYAVPGHPFDPRAQGPNKLIRDGATLIRNAQDVMEETLQNFTGSVLREPPAAANTGFSDYSPPDNMPENLHDTIIDHLSFTPIHVDELIRACHVSIPHMQTALLELELAGTYKNERRVTGSAC